MRRASTTNLYLKGLAGIVYLHLVLALPHRLSALEPSAFLNVAGALPALLVVLALVPRRLEPIVRFLLWVALGALLLLKAADMAAIAFQGRIFDPVTEWRLLGPAWNVVRHTLGTAQLIGLALGGLLILAAALAALWWALRRASRLVAPAPDSRRAVTVLAVAAGLWVWSAAAGGWRLPHTAPAVALLDEHVRIAAQNVRSLEALIAQAASDPVEPIPNDVLLCALRGQNVVLIFIESYGQTLFRNPRYGPRITRRLDAFADAVADTGLSARSAWLASPTVGGQSWLAHATLLSGLWIDSQRDYDWLMTSERATLNRLFRQAGWRTVAVMPAITQPWPDAAYYGYDKVYAERNLGYRGAPFNWITMPDQYTLSFLQRRVLAGGADDEDPPIMAEVALISSHAPWVPIPPLLPWDAIGDGSVFTPYARSGDPPAVVWQDTSRVRAQYLKAIDYVLSVLASFVRTYAGPNLTLIIVGDHQPATIVTGPEATINVPIHIVTTNPRLLTAADAWGWTAGMTPGKRSAHWRMDRFRARFVRAMSGCGQRQQ